MHAALSAAEAAARQLPFPTVVFGIGAFAGLVALLLVTYAFRNTGSRH